jgi:hypothetical protein
VSSDGHDSWIIQTTGHHSCMILAVRYFNLYYSVIMNGLITSDKLLDLLTDSLTPHNVPPKLERASITIQWLRAGLITLCLSLS